MKRKRKIASFLLAAIMVIAMALPVSAEATAIIRTPEDNTHTYKIFQIFTGIPTGDAGLSDIRWGEDAKKEYSFEYKKYLGECKGEDKKHVSFEDYDPSLLETDQLVKNVKTGDPVVAYPQEGDYAYVQTSEGGEFETYGDKDFVRGWDPVFTLESLVNASDPTKLNEAIHTYLGLEKLEDSNAKTLTGENQSINVEPGYYLIYDTMDRWQTFSLLKVVGDDPITVQPKLEKTTSEKKVKDKNDSNGEETDWQDSADYDIGDDVPFQLNATISSKYLDFVKNGQSYQLIFNDTLSKGLTLNEDSVTVKIDDEEITSGYELNPGPENSGITFQVVFSDLTDIKDDKGEDMIKPGSIVSVEYTAKLNEEAVIGSAGNPNELTVTFSDDSYNGESTETTTPDKVIVFTYKTIVNKVDENNNPLAGAEFSLEKKDATGNYVAVDEKKLTLSEDKTRFTFAGLDDGDYRLVETKAPVGYKKAEPIEFTITADHEVESDTPQLISINGGEGFTTDVADGSLTTDVVNNLGEGGSGQLPETGGMGTTLFYVIGAVLVLGAAVLLISRRRMNAEK